MNRVESMKSILDRTFKYVPAAATDIRKTIKREQARLKALADAKVVPIGKKKAAR